MARPADTPCPWSGASTLDAADGLGIRAAVAVRGALRIAVARVARLVDAPLLGARERGDGGRGDAGGSLGGGGATQCDVVGAAVAVRVAHRVAVARSGRDVLAALLCARVGRGRGRRGHPRRAPRGGGCARQAQRRVVGAAVAVRGADIVTVARRRRDVHAASLLGTVVASGRRGGSGPAGGRGRGTGRRGLCCGRRGCCRGGFRR